MAGKLDGKRIAFVVAPEGVEQVELTEPWKAVEEAGATPELLSTDDGEVQAFNHLDKADTFSVDRTVSQRTPARDARRGRRPPRPHHHLVAVAADRHPQRRREVGRRGGRDG
jgi:putative intracellular protease/amidase